jgi:hypothetical protein
MGDSQQISAPGAAAGMVISVAEGDPARRGSIATMAWP